MNGHILVMAGRLAAVRSGWRRRLIITVPPRHLKSLIGSVAFPAWCLGHNPSASLLCVSYAHGISRVSREEALAARQRVIEAMRAITRSDVIILTLGLVEA